MGGASGDTTEFGALEEGLISSCGRNLRVPLISDSDRRGTWASVAAGCGLNTRSGQDLEHRLHHRLCI